MRFALGILLFFVLTGCGFKSSVKSAFNKNGENINNFAGDDIDFQGGNPVFVSIIKLKTPALLSTVKKKKGEYIIDEDLKELILEEQAEFEKKLSDLSKDIKILFRYKMVLNGIAVEAPQELAEEINKLPFDFIEPNKKFHLPKIMKEEKSTDSNLVQNLEEKNSMTSMGVDKVHKLLKVLNESGELVPVKGQGVKVGIIDTGIDYTHKMLGGSGSVEEYEGINADKNTSSFPNFKIVGGKDFVGRDFSTSSHIYRDHVPVPDDNPIDYDGHGTHVAGTVGGVGDGVNTYSGAAPEAELYALKVFGDNGGSTADTVVIAALEYAVDPNADCKIDDKLDVVNMSLGGAYGEEHSLYSFALKNLQKADVVAVASAGNSGPIPNITGAPASSDAALSVAASIDYSKHNITFSAVKATSDSGLDLTAESVEGQITVSLKKGETLKKEIFYIGIAKAPLSEEQIKSLKGKIAFIDRGEIPFVEKIKTAISGGAVGVVLANNKKGDDPFVMGGEVKEKLKVPGFMISKENGDVLKEALKKGSVTVLLGDELLKPELVDTITSFSSQGPRNIDAGLKPEITAPGQQILSASAGTGNEGVKINGTSMSSPHIAGVAALLVQYRKNLRAKDIKSLILSTSKDMFDEKGEQYPISRKGAGLVQAYEALTSGVLMKTKALALGKLSVRNERTLRRRIRIKNIGDEDAVYSLSSSGDENIKISFSENNFSVLRNKVKTIDVELVVLAPSEEVLELNSFIEVRKNNKVEGRVPVLAVISKRSVMRFEGVGFSQESFEVEAFNRGKEDGEALIFNLLSEDLRKENPTNQIYTSACDIQSSGYRVVEREGVSLFQVAVKTYNPVTGWEICDVYVDLDYDGDEVPEHSVKGSKPSDWPKLGEDDKIKDQPISSMLFDSKKFEKINEDHAKEVARQTEKEPELDLTKSLIGLHKMTAYRSSTVVVVEVPVKIMKSKKMKMKVSTSYNNGHNINRVDVLDDDGKKWKDIDISEQVMAFSKMPEILKVPGKSSLNVTLSTGSHTNDLVVYFPRNRYILRETGVDMQSQILKVSDKGSGELP